MRWARSLSYLIVWWSEVVEAGGSIQYNKEINLISLNEKFLYGPIYYEDLGNGESDFDEIWYVGVFGDAKSI